MNSTTFSGLGNDVESVSRMTGIEPGRVRFLEAEFGRYLGAAPGGMPRARFGLADIDLLRVVHERVFVQGQDVQSVHRALSRERTAALRVIAVTSGKGGVGKTTVAVNLGLALVRGGARTLLIDADLGMGNVHVLTGLAAEGSIADVLRGAASIGEALAEGPGGLRILCGGSGIRGLADVNPALIDRFGRQLLELGDRFDAAILDTSAGISAQVQAFLGLADEVVVVTTPDMASLLDAYGVMKVLREARRPAPIRVLVNQVEREGEPEEVFGRIRACARRYLNDDPTFLGWLRRDRTVREANRQRQPVALVHPGAQVVRAFDEMARALRPARGGLPAPAGRPGTRANEGSPP